MLTLQFIQYTEIANLSSEERIKKLLEIVKDEKIILLEGKLKDEEEAELIKKTMEEINEKFTGIELGVLNPQREDLSFYRKIRKALIRFLLGSQGGFTIIGPANIIKEIKKDPDKIQLLTKEIKTKKSKKKKK